MQEIFTIIISLIAGIVMLFITMLAVARISDELNFYFAAPLLMIAYFGVLAYGAMHWRPLALIVTGSIWAIALLLALLDWLNQRQEKNQQESQQES